MDRTALEQWIVTHEKGWLYDPEESHIEADDLLVQLVMEALGQGFRWSNLDGEGPTGIQRFLVLYGQINKWYA